MTWILVIFLAGSGKAITTIPGFPTEQACLLAGKIVSDTGPTTACVPMPKGV